jgi:hypothetical protein
MLLNLHLQICGFVGEGEYLSDDTSITWRLLTHYKLNLKTIISFTTN